MKKKKKSLPASASALMCGVFLKDFYKYYGVPCGPGFPLQSLTQLQQLSIRPYIVNQSYSRPNGCSPAQSLAANP